MPEIPINDNKTLLLAAEKLTHGAHNYETPELYAVHPNRMFTVGTNLTQNVNLDIAINSWIANPLAHTIDYWR